MTVTKAAHLNQNRAAGAITFPIAGFCSSGIFAIFGIWTKLKYQSKPIHIIATMTCIYLNNQLQKTTSISKPPFPKYKPKNSKMDNAKEIWTVLDNDWRIEVIIVIIYNIFN